MVFVSNLYSVTGNLNNCEYCYGSHLGTIFRVNMMEHFHLLMTNDGDLSLAKLNYCLSQFRLLSGIEYYIVKDKLDKMYQQIIEDLNKRNGLGNVYEEKHFTS